jgi:broad specificity phosphatase PhoE
MPGGPVWLVRHASTEWTDHRWCGRSDPPLTSDGLAAAKVLAAELAAVVPSGSIVLASPLRRSLDTADAIADALGARVRVAPDLVEVDFGDVDGLTWDQLEVAHPALAESILGGKEPDWPGGEGAAQVAARAATAAERIRGLARSSAVVVVSHGGLLAALARAMGTTVAEDRFEPASAMRIDAVPTR